MLAVTKDYAPFERSLLLGYSLLLGLPLGTSFKALLANGLDGGFSDGTIDRGVVAVPLVIAIVLLCFWLGHMSLYKTIPDPEAEDITAQIRVLRSPHEAVALMAMTLYFGFASAMLMRVMWPPMSSLALGADDHDYGADVFVLAPAGNWLEALVPLWMLLGAVLLRLTHDLFATYQLP